jgi:glycosyltransferase involved in cell wall biosynthesis
MASGLPLIASNIRGVKDCCVNNVTGILCSPNNVMDFTNAIEFLVNNKEVRVLMGIASSLAAKKFDISNVNQIMKQIYSTI